MAAYLRFDVGQQSYAVSVLHVLEVLNLVKVTPVPDQPPDHLGVIMLRGRVIPVIDLRRRFDVGASALSLSTSLIAVRFEDEEVAIVVDAVDDVIDLSGEFEPYPEAAIDSITRLEGEIIMLPNVKQLVSV